MRIDAEQADARTIDLELPQGGIGGQCRSFHQFRRDACQRGMDPLMQRDMDDPQAAADQHQEHVVFRRLGQPRE